MVPRRQCQFSGQSKTMLYTDKERDVSRSSINWNVSLEGSSIAWGPAPPWERVDSSPGCQRPAPLVKNLHIEKEGEKKDQSQQILRGELSTSC